MKLFTSLLLALGFLAGSAYSVQANEARVATVAKAKTKAGQRHLGVKATSRHRSYMPTATRLAALKSSAVMILESKTGKVLYEKNARVMMPIASLTKLMMALVVLEARQDLAEKLTVTGADIDRLKFSSSRLQVGTRLTRSAMLHIALMSSENRAASALGRNYPGGTEEFVTAMNAKARALGMGSTHYVEPTGLSSANISSPEDLAKLVVAVQKHALIRRYSTSRNFTITQGRQRTIYHNTNRLTANPSWRIRLQKTGYISEAGRCMVLYATVKGRATVMVFLNSQGKFSRAADANTVRAWLISFRPSTRG